MVLFAERFGYGAGQNKSASHSDGPDLRQCQRRVSDD